MNDISDELSKHSCRFLKGVGPAIMLKLARVGVQSIQDVLFYLPRSYQDRTQLMPIGQVRKAQVAFIQGRIIAKQTPRFGKTRLLLQVADDHHSLAVRFFYMNAAQIKQYELGMLVRLYGEVRLSVKGYEMIHPECQRVESDTPLEKTLTPIYPSTEGLNQATWRRLTSAALDYLDAYPLVDYLPAEILSAYSFPALSMALRSLHRPSSTATSQLLSSTHPAQQRLAFEELLAHRLALLNNKNKLQAEVAPRFDIHSSLEEAFISRLEFQLTNAQSRVLKTIYEDFKKPYPMLRLVQGDVGSGKTLVAALAALQVVSQGYQVALMAPTEILAEQHALNFKKWFADFAVTIIYLSGSLKKKARIEALADIKKNHASIVIGTHALFQDEVEFANLGLMIVDEQHRFGVAQRLQLRQKALQAPHQLIMTATPIPRTLAMTAYADLDQSIIDELPAGRKPVNTLLISQERRHEVIHRVRALCEQSLQVYWVCTLIEESEQLDAQAAQNIEQKLIQELSGLRIALLHGRMKADEKEKVMRAFKQHEVDVLVSTTVIEVGVDVPNSVLMVIENPERLGLAQLHQLRGRVGRGDVQSYCVLLYQSPLSSLSSIAKQRLQIMRDCNDGFVLSEKDLELRGPGEVLGTRQSGDLEFKCANLIRDRALLSAVQEAVKLIDPLSARALIQRWLGASVMYQCV